MWFNYWHKDVGYTRELIPREAIKETDEKPSLISEARDVQRNVMLWVTVAIMLMFTLWTAFFA
jgi:hypothetical protein